MIIIPRSSKPKSSVKSVRTEAEVIRAGVDNRKQTADYKKCLMECIRKEDADREYTIDTYIADECNNPNLHYSINKIEEYIPQY